MNTTKVTIPAQNNPVIIYGSDNPQPEKKIAIRISTDAMSPSFCAGSVVITSEIPTDHIIPGEVYVIVTESDMLIKRLFYRNDNQLSDSFECVSDNCSRSKTGPRQGQLLYPSFFIDKQQIRKVLKVVGSFESNDLQILN